MRQKLSSCAMLVALFLVAAASAVTAAGQIQPLNARLAPRLLNYQGYLTDTLGNPINNLSLSLSFAIFDSPSGGNQKWSETQASVVVIKGIFNVLLGSVFPIPDSVFLNGTDRWLELTVAGQTLTPRTRIVSAGYAYTATYSDTALFAKNATADYDWSFLASDGADTTLQMGGRWGLTRPGNVLYGNADSTHVNFGVACTTGASGNDMKYCTVGGGYDNNASNNNATVGGGMSNEASEENATVGGGEANTANQFHTTVSGGFNNTASGSRATVGGGYENTASGGVAAVAGGQFNTASNNYTTVGGGYQNVASGSHATVGGGNRNIASNSYATVGGGSLNAAGGLYSMIAGGYADTVAGDYSVAAGHTVRLTGTADYTFAFGRNFTTSTRNAVIFYNSVNPIKTGIGTAAPDTTLHIVGNIKMIDGNQALGKIMTSDANGLGTWQLGAASHWLISVNLIDTVMVTGGLWGLARNGNVLYGYKASTHTNFGVSCTTGYETQDRTYCTIGGGYGHRADGWSSTIGGGNTNSARGDYATVAGGSNNHANYMYSFVGGGGSNYAGGMYAVVNGGNSNATIADYAAIAGGYNNYITGTYSTIGGGDNNTANGNRSTVAGGEDNTSDSLYSTVSGGFGNVARANYATVDGGGSNTASGNWSVVGGGYQNVASNYYSTIGGGRADTSSGITATVPGGLGNKAAGNYSFAAGRRAKANHAGSFVWADSTNSDFASTGTNQFIIRASGGVGIGTANPQRTLHVSAVMRLEPLVSAPSSPAEGDIYMDATTHKLMVYDGTTWQACW